MVTLNTVKTLPARYDFNRLRFSDTTPVVVSITSVL